jgi:hypothetical protein
MAAALAYNYSVVQGPISDDYSVQILTSALDVIENFKNDEDSGNMVVLQVLSSAYLWAILMRNLYDIGH